MSANELGITNGNGSIDAALDSVLIKQLIWKHASCRKIAVRICNQALKGGLFFPESISHEDLPADDLNTIGLVFRALAGRRFGIIRRTSTFKRSDRAKAPNANGRTAFAYTLEKRGLAEALVKRLGNVPETRQQNLL